MRRATIAQHLVAALILFTTGQDRIHHDAILGSLEIAAGAVLIAGVVYEKIRHVHPGGGGVAWVELAGAVMVFMEAVEKTKAPHHFLFYVLSFIQPIILFAFAIFDAQVNARRFIKADDDGLEVRLRIWRGKRVRWDEIREYRLREDAIDFGGRSISLRDVADRDQARQWIEDRLRSRAIANLM